MSYENIDSFFRHMRRQHLALGYSDIRLATAHSDVLPAKTQIQSRFSRHIDLMVPITSAAMDTVTEQGLAIAMAEQGGLGVLHYNLTPAEQAKQVRRVKYHLNQRIESPRTVRESQTVQEVLAWREAEQFRFHTFPVVNNNGKFVGVVTKDDFDYCGNTDQTQIQQIMTAIDQVISGDCSLTAEEAYALMLKHHVKMIPLLENGEVTALYIHSDLKRHFSKSETMFNLDEQGRLRVGAAIGVGQSALERAAMLVERGVDVLVIDSAHGDSSNVIDTLSELKRNYAETDVVVGNVSEPDSALALVRAGADGIKIGQGPGSICTTRVISGIGCPQATAVYECARAVRDVDVPVCADGGITNSGDIVIALALGAHSVMLGRLLAGTKEAPGELVRRENGSRFKKYRGMGSLSAMRARESSRERYRQPIDQVLVPEGIEGLVPYIGTVAEVLAQYTGGLRKGMGYCGAQTLLDLQQSAKLHRLTEAGWRESHPHDIVEVQDSPNYSGR